VEWCCNMPTLRRRKSIQNKQGYKCRNIECQKKFTSIVGTIFENTKMPLRTWFGAIYLCANHKKGISSLQLGRDLGIHQSSAWFLLHRIRETMKEINILKLGGEGCIVEVDTTIVGGKAKNMHKSKRKAVKGNTTGAHANKTAVTAYVERGGNIRFDVKDAGETEKGLLENTLIRILFL